MKRIPFCLWICRAALVAPMMSASAQQLPDAAGALLKDMTSRHEAHKAELRKPLDALTERYRAALEKSKDQFVSNGNLDGVLSAKEALKSLAEGTVPPDSKNADLDHLREIYVTRRAELCKEAGARAQHAAVEYLEGLSALTIALTKQEKIEEATAVAKQRDALQALLGDTTENQNFTENFVIALLRPGLAPPPAGPRVVAAKTTPAPTTTRPPLGGPSPTRAITLKIRVDGDDIVKIQEGRLWIEHHSWKKPIAIAVNGSKWEPSWNAKMSDTFTKFDPPLAPFPDTGVKVHQIIGRGKTTVVEQPSAANGRTLSFHVEDDGGGADNYEVHVTW